LFPDGLIGTFFEITEYFTNPRHIFQVASGDVDTNTEVFKVVKFIIAIGAYYLLAALLVFVIDIFMPKEKKK
jgi:hypothetical protein